jgi:DNA-binding NarL/FixJ family response regulator
LRYRYLVLSGRPSLHCQKFPRCAGSYSLGNAVVTVWQRGVSNVRDKRPKKMPAAQRFVTPIDREADVGELLELVLAARGQKLEKRLLAAALRTLAVWLGDQARQLAEDGVSNMRLLPGPSLPPPTLLTKRELEVASRIARGFSNRQIAEDLVITLSTTERHVANILSKLQMRSRAQIAAWVVELRL